MGGFRARVRIASIAVIAALLLGGCTPGHQDTGVAEGADRRLYTGPIPAPAPLPASPIGPYPKAPADPSDTAASDRFLAELQEYNEALMANQEAVIAYADDLKAFVGSARLGGERSVAVWQTVLVTAGIAVNGADGTPVEIDGNSGFGWAMTDAELRLHAVLSTAPGGLRLVDLADALKGIPELAEADVATALQADLMAPGDAGFSQMLHNLGPLDLYGTAGAKPIDEVTLSWAEVGVVLRRLSAEIATHDAAQSGSAASSYGSLAGDGALQAVPASFSSAIETSGSKKACELKIDNPWASELLNQFNKAHSTFVFDKVIELLDDGIRKPTGQKGTTGAKIGIARVINAFLAMGAKAAAIEASFSLADAPLVRTKTPQPGELRELTVKYRFNELIWEDVRGCINLFVAPFGFDALGSQAGVASNIDIDLASGDPGTLRIGDGKGGNTPVTQGTTDANGEAKFTLSGAPQPDFIPDQAEAEEVQIVVRAVSNLGGNDFYKDLASLPWDALDAAGSGGLSVVPIMLSRMKLITHSALIPVRDWSLEADFEVTLIGSLNSRVASNSIGACGGPAHSSSTEASTSMASDAVAVSALLLSNPDGNLGDQAAIFVPLGEEPQLYDYGQGVWMFDLPLNYTTNKMHYEPGNNLPPLYVAEQVKCAVADGGGDGHVPYEPPVDCGERSYSAMAGAVISSPRVLHVGEKSWMDEQLWLNCGNGVHITAPSLTALTCDSPQQSGGAMPSLSDLFDSSKKIIEVDGALSCSKSGNGWIEELDYEWTLVFCRITDGESAC